MTYYDFVAMVFFAVTIAFVAFCSSNARSRRDLVIRAWGSFNAMLGLGVVLVVAFGVPTLYGRVVQSSTVLSVILAASVLGWAYFARPGLADSRRRRRDHDRDWTIDRMSREIRRLRDELEWE